MTSATRRSRSQVVRLHRPGPSPSRVLLVASPRLRSAPQGRYGQHFAEMFLDRSWLLQRGGVDLDVLQSTSPVLQSLSRERLGDFARHYDLVVVLVDPRASKRRRARALVAQRRAVAAAAPLEIVFVDTVRGPVRGGPMRSTASSVRDADSARGPSISLRRPDAARRLAGAVQRERGRGSEAFPDPETTKDPLAERLQQVVDIAQASFEVDRATIDLLQDGRLRTVASSGSALTAPAHPASLPGLTVARGHLLLIPDLQQDRRWQLQGGQVSFYAGQPFRADDGRTIGTLNLYGRAPIAAETFDAAVMSDLTLLVEGEVAVQVAAAVDGLPEDPLR